MKNAGLAGAIALCGIGLMMIGLGNFVKAPSAMAYTPAVVATVQGEGEPTIVWYDSHITEADAYNFHTHLLFRAWSNGLIEVRFQRIWYDNNSLCGEILESNCLNNTWFVISSPTEGLNAAADITFDEVVDGQDLATLLASWGEAPRNPMPPSDCPLGLMN